MSLTLNEPVKKKLKYYNNFSSYNRKPQFPITVSSEDQFFSEDFWFISTGRFNGLSVVVDDPEEMKTLHTMGFFGKGCLSKRVPNFQSQGKGPPILKERQWERRKIWSKCIEELLENKTEANNESDCSEPENKRLKLSTRDENCTNPTSKDDITSANEILLICDSDNEDNYMDKLNPRIETEKVESVVESLHLSLEEAFFLTYGLGCLQVIDLLGNLLPITTLWNVFRHTDANFVDNYVAYHNLRAKGWVVKSGMQFGGQFILYKKGPVFYHSTYVVLVEVYSSDGKREKNDLSLFKLTNLNRLAEASFKEVLICEIHRPEVTENEMQHPDVLTKFTVRENLMRRWLPNLERQLPDQIS